MKLKLGHLEVEKWIEEDGRSPRSQAAVPDWYVRQRRVSQTEDQRRIAHVARNDPDSHVRIVALLRLRDPELIEDIARRDTDETVRAVALLCAGRNGIN